MKFIFIGFIFLSLCPLFSVEPNLQIFKKETLPEEKTFLLLGGIQGDEPGGFNAATIVASPHYTIKKGNIWVIPNLNQHSILENHRGIYGDMNRKFDKLSKSDPEYARIQSIKKIIKDEKIEVILHLHDGSGFYNEAYISSLQNPKRWGQIGIIDQEKLEDTAHGELNQIMKQVTDEINQHLLNDLHRYRIRNTNTATSDKEQQKSLTFYAIKQKKAAFANEASKSLNVNERVYYHLLSVEAMMKYLGIEFERDFDLTPQGVSQILNDENILIHFDNRITLPINRLKSIINYFPMTKNLGYHSDNPIVHYYVKGKNHLIKYGNRVSTKLSPDFFSFDDSLPEVTMTIDKQTQQVAMGQIIKAKESFLVNHIDDPSIRVNIIGFQRKGVVSEENITLKKSDISSRYTLDASGYLVRVEFYKNRRFCGMIIIDFKNEAEK
ncbi:hypothetical protein CCZ01_01905 [Helicobacter monodelphidis]|uniref:M99 family carboxypeptidase catalytic domain-containing protein n=1 Tax=Helicobacter sp. 15-1451 TaxID=2004995 RepID=UPI000DCDAA76|nr:M99 family carboxypeptidase catalytic domain-containing protein [Helicobacter sp. 15-1451]RAX58561.1 hypothetical protein CCZ01_01905 [Helicobacter sp. 15-1451]